VGTTTQVSQAYSNSNMAGPSHPIQASAYQFTALGGLRTPLSNDSQLQSPVMPLPITEQLSDMSHSQSKTAPNYVQVELNHEFLMLETPFGTSDAPFTPQNLPMAVKGEQAHGHSHGINLRSAHEFSIDQPHPKDCFCGSTCHCLFCPTHPFNANSVAEVNNAANEIWNDWSMDDSPPFSMPTGSTDLISPAPPDAMRTMSLGAAEHQGMPMELRQDSIVSDPGFDHSGHPSSGYYHFEYQYNNLPGDCKCGDDCQCEDCTIHRRQDTNISQGEPYPLSHQNSNGMIHSHLEYQPIAETFPCHGSEGPCQCGSGNCMCGIGCTCVGCLSHMGHTGEMLTDSIYMGFDDAAFTSTPNINLTSPPTASFTSPPGITPFSPSQTDNFASTSKGKEPANGVLKRSCCS
jgi:hypothetical protein